MNLSDLAIQNAIKLNWQSAVDINLEILKDDPENIEALNRLAQAYLQLENIQEAIKIYKKVLKIDRLNRIAKKNLARIENSIKNNNQTHYCKNVEYISFIEEPGKTKVVSLVRTGEKHILNSLSSCIPLDINVRAKTITLYYDKKYIGKLPDDVSRRLIWLIKRQNRYCAYIKDVQNNRVRVFLKETKRSQLNADTPSFVKNVE